MAKIRHNHFLDTVDGVISDAKSKGLVHLYAEDASFDGRHIRVGGESLRHFGTTGYLGLGLDHRLKEAALEAIRKYGTQFPLSKTYISHPLYRELEEKIREMYGLPVLITKNSTLGHIAVIPSIVGDEDGVILDHQVHWSVQYAVQSLKVRGIPVHMIRHNNMDMLENMVRDLSGSCRKIWYMADGVYSMFGDCAPIAELEVFLERYPQLCLYFDDVHGMSWVGPNGTGYVMSRFKTLPERVFLFGTLSKSFGASGAVFVTSDKELHRKVRIFGGPLTFSAQLEPASVAAAIASAHIHLSPEIQRMQQELRRKIEFLNTRLAATQLPLVDINECPVFYIGTGSPATGYNFVNRLMKAGYYVNLGLYPAVPVKNTGVRLTLSSHNTVTDIAGLVDAMEYHYPLALRETHNSLSKVRRAFGMTTAETISASPQPQSGLNLDYYTSIQSIDPRSWDTLFGGANTFDWNGLQFLEQVCNKAEKTEHRWGFHYVTIQDKEGSWVLATFLTTSLWKDDMLAPPGVSEKIETKRIRDPYYLTSNTLAMGSLFSTGNHLYWNQSHPKAQAAFRAFIQFLESLMERTGATLLVLRDFEDPDFGSDELAGHGFVRIAMPQSNKVTALTWTDPDSYVQQLSSRSRRHFRKEVAPFEQYFKAEWVSQVSPNILDHCYQLFRNVHRKNLSINTFPYPREFFTAMGESPAWEFMLVYGREQTSGDFRELPVGVMFCYLNQGITYVPHLIGMDYTFVEKYGLYRQMLYQSLLRASRLGFQKLDFGLSASFEKKKAGALPARQWAYVQAKDNYSMEYLETLQGSDS